jgi:hypothetical protein
MALHSTSISLSPAKTSIAVCSRSCLST